MSPVILRQSSLDVASQRAPTLALEVNRLFSLYRPFIGDRQPMAGGAQGLLMKHNNSNFRLPRCANNRGGFRVELTFNTDHCNYGGKFGDGASTSFCDLPVRLYGKVSNLSNSIVIWFEKFQSEIKLYIFTLLPLNDLCKAGLVNKDWSQLANDERLWKHLLDRDSNRWRQIYGDRNPDIYRQVCPYMSSKQMCVNFEC